MIEHEKITYVEFPFKDIETSTIFKMGDGTEYTSPLITGAVTHDHV